MQWLRQLPRTVYNVTVLRGRRRATRLVVVLALSVLTFMTVRHGVCTLQPERCHEVAEDVSVGLNREHRDRDVGRSSAWVEWWALVGITFS